MIVDKRHRPMTPENKAKLIAFNKACRNGSAKLKERWMHKNVFETFLMMGPERTYRKLAELTGKSLGQLGRWGKSFDWKTRLEERDRSMTVKLQEDNDKAYLEEVKNRHLESYKKIQTKAIEAIEKKGSFDNDDGKGMAVALDIGIKGEREVLGLRNTNIKAALAKEGFCALVEAVIGPT